MTTKVHHIAVLIDCDSKQASHWFELFQQLKQYLKCDIQFMIWDNDLANIARSTVDIDSVHLLSRSILKFNDYKAVNLLIQKYSIEKCIEIGNIPRFISWKLKQNESINIYRILDNLQNTDSISEYDLTIYPSNTSKINYQQKIASIPFPRVNYKNFLDLDTQKVLDIKQNLSLISYENQVIQKSFVCGHIGLLSNEFIKYLEYNECEWYDITTKQGSFVLSDDLLDNLAVVYELLDCLIVSGEIDDNMQYQLLNAMASGTIIIAPRNEQYQELLGKGALYYNPNLSSELNACIEVIQKNESKKLAIRAFASEQFQRKYSYQAIAQFIAHILAKS
jgi:hypothetical protein